MLRPAPSSVVILNGNHPYGFGFSSLLRREFENETKLIVQPHRPLMAANSLQLLVMQGFKCIKVSLVGCGTNEMHSSTICSHQFGRKPGLGRVLTLEPFKEGVDVPNEIPKF